MRSIGICFVFALFSSLGSAQTPAANPKGARALPVEVRWNAKVKRYQSMDRNFENFLYELPALETPESQVRL